MNRISGDGALAQYLSNNANAAKWKNTGVTPFQQLLASATSSISIDNNGAAVKATDVSPDSVKPTAETQFISDLNVALNAYGIGTSPSLRIDSGPDGLQLDNDPRNAKFQAMLRDNPALAQALGSMIGTAQMQRKQDLNEAIAGFGGSNPTGTMRDFLDSFSKTEDPQSYSVSFNGAAATVDELDSDGWHPVKDKAQIVSDMLAAYAKYLTQYGVSTEKQKDKKDDDAAVNAAEPDVDRKKKLAAAAEN